MEQFSRTIRLIGDDAFSKLQKSRVAVLGVGGVGSNAAMTLCRAGIGSFLLVDKDVVDITNINRQSIARLDTVGLDKVEVMAEDMKKINTNVAVDTRKVFLEESNIKAILDDSFDYVLDCIDNITAKIYVAKHCSEKHIPIISCMGAGNRTNALFKIVDIYDTYNDPVSKIMRKRLKEEGIPFLDVVWTDSLPAAPKDKERTPASTSFSPALAGITMAQYVFNQIIN